MPGKIFEYLAARTPILCLEDQATMAGQIITSCGCGETCSFHDKEKMKACIMHYFASPVFEGDEEKIAAYSRRRLTEHLIQYID